jgi:hypothetical protein
MGAGDVSGYFVRIIVLTSVCLCNILRMYVYSQVAAVVEPKRAKLKEAQVISITFSNRNHVSNIINVSNPHQQAELEVTEQMLKEKQAALKIVSDRVAALEASFAQTLREQEDLKSQV